VRSLNTEITKFLDGIEAYAIKPLILELVEETGRPIQLTITAFHQGQFVEKLFHSGSDAESGGSTANGEVRIVLKSLTSPCGFAVEAIINDLSPGTGFSGFSMRGKANLDDEPVSVRITAHTNRYNVWEWSKDFRRV
jgi:hypothetical protein